MGIRSLFYLANDRLGQRDEYPKTLECSAPTTLIVNMRAQPNLRCCKLLRSFCLYSVDGN